jgi:hemerythrin-like domain-containing protein
LSLGGVIGVSLAASRWTGRAAAAQKAHKASETEEEISPAEDLMREHGVLERVLIIYETSMARVTAQDASPLPVVVRAADLTRRFIEDYHERLEEQFLFPRFESAGTMVELVRTLRTQHDRGRALTDEIRSLAQGGGTNASGDGSRLNTAVQAFVRMYRPHAAREDTVLFPAFRKLVPAREYADLGEQFEDREHALFGKSGFEDIVGQVAQLEETLGIFDLNRFTPV